MPLVHGFWQQRTLAVLGRMLTITLIARRSRHFAGTRYRKRGIHMGGHVANDVETEQIASAGFDWRSGYPVVSSAVQVGCLSSCWVQALARLCSAAACTLLLLCSMACCPGNDQSE